MFCGEVMTEDPVRCVPNDLVSAAAPAMRREDVDALPVINDEQRQQLIGIVTDRDLAIKVIAESRDPGHTVVQDVMTLTIVVCRECEDLSNAIKAMEEHEIRRIPVIDDDGRLVGIISQADVAIHFYEPRRKAELLEEVSQAA
jgi:CBS domain-containing protein